MQVKALSAGYYGSYREAGDVFEVPDGETATWFEPVETEPSADDAQEQGGKRSRKATPLA